MTDSLAMTNSPLAGGASEMPLHRIDRDEVMSLVILGASHRSVARKLGVHPSSVDLIVKQHRSEMRRFGPKLPAPPRPRERSPDTPRFVRVPAEYRAAGLADDYRDPVRDFGDVEGERRCRRLLNETRRLEALDARLGRAA